MWLNEWLKIDVRLCDGNMTKIDIPAISIMENLLSQDIQKEYLLALEKFSNNNMEEAKTILLKIKSWLERTNNAVSMLYVEILYKLGIISYNTWNWSLDIANYNKTIKETLEKLWALDKVCIYDLGRLV